jgi:hypothetical protein
MGWLIDDQNELPKGLRESIEQACKEPGALGPATKASVSAAILMVTRLAVVAEKRLTEFHNGFERRISQIEGRQDKLADLERKITAFDPLQFKDRESGKRSIRMQLTDGREAVLTSEVTAASGETLVERASRVDRLEGAAREIESQLQVLQQQLSAAHKRIGVLERTIKEPQ